MTGWALLAAVGLLAVNAFFVAAEFALLASRPSRLEPLAEHDRSYRPALAAVRNLQPQLAGAQLGITMASLGLGFVAEPAVARLVEGLVGDLVDLPDDVLHTIGFVVGLSIVVVVHMVLGEMVPKNVAIAAPERAARWLAPVHRGYVTLFRPVVVSLNLVANGIVRLLGFTPVDEINTALTVNEFHTLLRGAHDQGVIEDAERELLAGALDFRARTAGSIMVPWSSVVTVDRRTPLATVESTVAATGHTRLPMTGRSHDDVLGFVHAKDLLRLPPEARDEPVPLEVVRRMLVVGPERPLRDLMATMRRARRHMALVRDGSGRTLGMVTLEDVLEALVGDIRDESDVRPLP